MGGIERKESFEEGPDFEHFDRVRSGFSDEVAGALFDDVESEKLMQFDEDAFKVRPKQGYPEHLIVSQNRKMMGYNESNEYWEKRIKGNEMSWVMSKRKTDKIKGGLSDEEYVCFGIDLRTLRGNVVLCCLLIEAEERLKEAYREKFGKELDMKFSRMEMKNSSKSKHHGKGVAVDFDAEQNWLASPDEVEWNIPDALAYTLQDLGLAWGMFYDQIRSDGQTDAMHFDMRIDVGTAMSQLKSARALKLAKSFRLPYRGGISLYDYGMTKLEQGT